MHIMEILKNIPKALHDRFFNPENEFPATTIEHRLFCRLMQFYCIMCLCFLISSLITGPWSDPMVMIFLFCTINFYINYRFAKAKEVIGRAIILYCVLTNLPCFIAAWFFNGGSSGGSQYVFYPYLLTGLVVLQRHKVAFIAKTFIVIAILVILEYLYPNLITTNKTRGAKYIDIGLSYILYGYVSLYIFLYYTQEHRTVLNRLQSEKKTVEEQRLLLEDANEKLKELDRVKTNFFSNVSHEFKTPLTLLVSPVESIVNGEYGDTIDRKNAIFGYIYRNALRLQNLIGTILNFTRLESGGLKPNFSPVDAARLADFCVNTMRSHAESKEIAITLALPESPVLVNADRDLLESALFNILSNAFKFTESGGDVTVNVCRRDGNAVISVRDSGIGIPRDKLSFIFDRFSQVDSGSSRKYEGTGIGLAYAKEIIELHGGSIITESRFIDDFPQGHGSEFILSFPAIDALENTVESSHSPVDKSGVAKIILSGISPVAERRTGDAVNSGITEIRCRDEEAPSIMVVEDHADMRSYLRDILQGSFHLVLAANGRQAIDHLAGIEEIPDLIVSDIMMPELDGYAFTSALRADPRFEGTPIILLTAKADLEMKLEGFETGATDYITKPFSSRELLARVNAHLKMKKLRDTLERSNRALYARLKEGDDAEYRVSKSAEEKIARVVDFIRDNFSADLSREGLAAAVDLSPDHLSRAFNAATGTRIDEYINALRIQEAEKLLSGTNDTVLAISFNVGFENVRTFNRAFQKLNGMSPTAYRSRSKE